MMGLLKGDCWPMNPIDYWIENISWYETLYNISWTLFMVFALTLPPALLAIFHLPGFRSVQFSPALTSAIELIFVVMSAVQPRWSQPDNASRPP